jgi:hypothetical protein
MRKTMKMKASRRRKKNKTIDTRDMEELNIEGNGIVILA